MTLENKHWKSLLVDFIKSHWKEEYKKYLFVETEYASGGENPVVMFNKWFLRLSKISIDSILLNLKYILS